MARDYVRVRRRKDRQGEQGFDVRPHEGSREDARFGGGGGRGRVVNDVREWMSWIRRPLT